MEKKEFLISMWNNLKKFYDYLVTVPDRLYPFTEVTQTGVKLTSERAYTYVAEENKNKFDDAYSLQAPKLLLWREAFHFGASVFFVAIADQMFRHMSFFNGFSLLVFVVVMVGIQEFYLHPHYYGQKPQKGMIDFAVWMLPIVLYILI